MCRRCRVFGCILGVGEVIDFGDIGGVVSIGYVDGDVGLKM